MRHCNAERQPRNVTRAGAGRTAQRASCARRRWRSRLARPSSCIMTRTSSGSMSASMRLRRPPRLSAITGAFSSGAVAMYPQLAS